MVVSSESVSKHFDSNCRVEADDSAEVDDEIEERSNIGALICVINVVASISIIAPSILSSYLQEYFKLFILTTFYILPLLYLAEEPILTQPMFQDKQDIFFFLQIFCHVCHD